MNEYIITILLLQKTKPLAVIEPFYCTLCHVLYLLLILRGYFVREVSSEVSEQ